MRTVVFPASFYLNRRHQPFVLAAIFNLESKTCSCSPQAIHQKYLNKLSGPLLDRIDLHVEVMAVSAQDLTADNEVEDSASIRERVIQARELQTERFRGSEKVHSNAQMSPSMIKRYCKLDDGASALLVSALNHLHLSGRAHDRILKVSRTIADLDREPGPIRHSHVSEAIGYRSLDKRQWIDQAASLKSKNGRKNFF